MLRKKLFIKLLLISLLIFCAGKNSPAQKPSADKNTALAKFEKSLEQGDFSIERDLLNYAIQNPNDAKGFELLAGLRFNQNRLNEARSLYQKALSLDPNMTAAKINLAVINFQTGNSALSVSALNEITAKELSNDALRLKLAQTFALVGDCPKALATLENLGLKVKNGEALPLRAQCYLKTRENQKISALIPLANSLIKQNPAIPVKFAGALMDGAMYKESADILLTVVKTFPQNADAQILLAKAEIFLKDFANAKIHLGQASKIKPQPADLFFVQGLLESERGNAAEALAFLEKALAATPDSPAVLRQFVISAIRANENGKAVKAAGRLLQLNPDDADYIYLYGAASLQNNNLQAAEPALTRYFELRPQDARGCVALGLVFAAQPDKLDVARRQMEKCIAINPNNTEAKYQLGLSYKAQGENEKAVRYFEATIGDAPDYASALRDLGAVYIQMGDEAKARVVLEKSVALQPDDADTHFQLSRLYNIIGETGLAKKHLEIFQKLKNPKKDGM